MNRHCVRVYHSLTKRFKGMLEGFCGQLKRINQKMLSEAAKAQMIRFNSGGEYILN